MAKATRTYLFDALEILPSALSRFVEQRLDNTLGDSWRQQVATKLRLKTSPEGKVGWDQAGLLIAINHYFDQSFKDVLGREERAIVNELIVVRNKFAHNETFSYNNTERALDSMRRLMDAIGATKQSETIGRMRDSVLRVRFEQERRNEQRKKETTLTKTGQTAHGNLKPWRHVIEPHTDVATGEFLKAEFAADLGKVHSGSALSEFSDAKEFFARTYLTDGLSALLMGAAKRLSGKGGDPVVELETNFGGGKTHSMLALYHMVGGTPMSELTGLDQLLSNAKIELPKKVNRAVLVGTSRGPLDPFITESGQRIFTTWGELAWQLGGASAYDLISNNDSKGIAPGSNLLEEVFRKCEPCLILIDEWVAFLRQIYKVDGLPSGNFDSNLSFVQSLTEAVKACPSTILVASLPSSQIEVGGEGGEAAKERIKQTFARIESSWRAATQDESYEIVRRRLFKPIESEQYRHKENTVRQFENFYREEQDEFPLGTPEASYRRKLDVAYPIHPELFDQLYSCWGSLDRFQRTRGVLRLMAQVVHELWMHEDASAMIMPGSVPVGTNMVQSELLRYVDESWQSIIAGDIDGPQSIPLEIDRHRSHLNQFSATRLVARAIFMGTAPLHRQPNKGLDKKQICRAVVQPGENPGIFQDALRHLGTRAQFLHSDTDRYWFSVSESLNRMALDRAGQIEKSTLLNEIDVRLRQQFKGIKELGQFTTTVVAPYSNDKVPDNGGGVQVVILGVNSAHDGKEDSAAITEGKNILEQCGAAGRIYRNTLVFLAADKTHLENLMQAVSINLAWDSIQADIDKLNLTPSDVAQARKKLVEASKTVEVRISEAWCHFIYPDQESAEQEKVAWKTTKVGGGQNVLREASKRMERDEALVTVLGPNRLNKDLIKYIWNDNCHLHLNDIQEYHDRYLYLPRLKDSNVLARTVKAAIEGLIPGPFAYAESYEEETNTYIGLTISQSNVEVAVNRSSVIVEASVAKEHLELHPTEKDDENDEEGEDEGDKEKEPIKPTKFSGTVEISSQRPVPEIAEIMEGIVQPLTGLPNHKVTLRLEVNAEIPDGMDEKLVRIIRENANTLEFKSSIN